MGPEIQVLPGLLESPKPAAACVNWWPLFALAHSYRMHWPSRPSPQRHSQSRAQVPRHRPIPAGGSSGWPWPPPCLQYWTDLTMHTRTAGCRGRELQPLAPSAGSTGECLCRMSIDGSVIVGFVSSCLDWCALLAIAASPCMLSNVCHASLSGSRRPAHRHAGGSSPLLWCWTASTTLAPEV